MPSRRPFLLDADRRADEGTGACGSIFSARAPDRARLPERHMGTDLRPPLLRLRSVEKTATLSLGCATHEEFRSRLDDLNELFKLIDIPDEILDENGRRIDKQQTFKRMTACLELRITDEAERERISDAMGDLRAVNTVRNKLAHGGAELVEALSRLRIDYPIRDYSKAWDTVRARTAEALTTIRSALQGAT